MSEHLYNVTKCVITLIYYIFLIMNYSTYSVLNNGSESIIDLLLGYPSYEFIDAFIVRFAIDFERGLNYWMTLNDIDEWMNDDGSGNVVGRTKMY